MNFAEDENESPAIAERCNALKISVAPVVVNNSDSQRAGVFDRLFNTSQRQNVVVAGLWLGCMI
jgi:hypothetical protein